MGSRRFILRSTVCMHYYSDKTMQSSPFPPPACHPAWAGCMAVRWAEGVENWDQGSRDLSSALTHLQKRSYASVSFSYCTAGQSPLSGSEGKNK